MEHLGSDTLQRLCAGGLPDGPRRNALRHVDACSECRELLLVAATPPAVPPPVELPIASQDRYLIDGLVGQGGGGTVLRALDRPLGRTVAIKELSASGPGLEQRFLREALITAELQHPGIVPVFDVGRWSTGQPFYSMKLVSGETLRALLAGARTLEERLALLPHLIAVGEALAFAHARGVIHRDVKPSNILVGEFGETVLIDWGLAKRIGGDEPPDDGFIGTVLYMSPEQARRAAADARSDVYSLGVVLYELLAGAPPYATDGSIERLAWRVAAGQIRPLRARTPEAPRDLVVIAERALSLDPRDRYPSAKELAQDLKRFATGQLVSARAYSTWELVARQARRHARTLAALAAALAVTLAVLVGAVVRVARERTAAKKSLARVELDQARHAYLADDPLRAVEYLAASLRDGGEGPVARFLSARARRALGQRRFVVPAHDGNVNALDVSPDGSRVATGGADGAVRIWDAAGGGAVHTLTGHLSPVVTVAFDREGRRLVSATRDGEIKLWDAARGTLVRDLDSEGMRAASVRLSPDGATLVGADADGKLRVWDVATGELKLEIAAHEGWVSFAAITPDGRRIVSTGEDRALKIWRTGDGSLVCQVEVAKRSEWIASGLAPDGRRVALAIGESPIVRIYSTLDCAPVASWNADVGEAFPPSFDPKGRRLVVSGTRSVAIFDTELADPPQRLSSGALARAVAFSPDGDRVAVAAADGPVTVYTTTGHRYLGLVGRKLTRVLAWSPSGDRLFAGGTGGTLSAWEAPVLSHGVPPPPLVTLKVQVDLSLLGITVAGDLVRSDSRMHDFTVVAPGICKVESTPIRWVDRCRVGENGLVLRNQGASAEVLDGASGRVLSRVTGDAVDEIAFSGTGRLAAARSTSGTIEVWEASTGRPVRLLRPEPPALAIAFIGEERLVTEDRDGAAVWDLATGARTLAVASRSPSPWALVAASARTNRFFFVGSGRDAELRDAGTGELIALLEKGPFTLDASFDPEGRMIATVDSDDRLRLWDAGSGTLLDALDAGRNPAAVWVGQTLISTNDDGERREWDLGSDERPTEAILGDLEAIARGR